MTPWRQVAAADQLQVWRGPGEGPAVVMVHGLEDSWTSWRPVAERLDGFSTYSLKLPWCGGNTAAWRADGSPAQWLQRAIELVPEQPVALVGHSFGANAILAHLATTEPDPGLAAVVLAAPFYRPADFPVTPQLRVRARAALRKVLIEGLRLTVGARGRDLAPELFTAMTEKLFERALPEGFPIFFAEFAASGELDLRRVGVPTLVVLGPSDEGLTPARATALAEAMPAATLRARRSYGHFCHLTQAEQLSRDIAGWVRRGPGQPEQPITEQGGPTVTELLDGEPTSLVGRPRYEGANIRTWIGFKHFMYLVEEAVLEYFRERGLGARLLYHQYGLGLEIVDSSAQLPMTLQVDDQVCATVVSAKPKPGHGAPFTVQLTVEKDGATATALTGKVRVALVPVKDGSGVEPVPSFLEPYVVPEVAALRNSEAATLEIADGQDVADVLVPADSNSYLWSWRAPYYYCHFSDRLQHSAYVRTLEEVVDRFLHDRGLAIGTLLAERAWIPVVSRARVQLLDDAWMEETVHTVFTVEDLLLDKVYTARMDCYVRRGNQLIRTATATIMHGYAISRGEGAGSVATFDEQTKALLLGGAR